MPAPSLTRRQRRSPRPAAIVLACATAIAAFGTAGPAMADPHPSAVVQAPPSPPSPDDVIGLVQTADRAADAAAFELLASGDAAKQAAVTQMLAIAQRDQEAARAAAASRALVVAERHVAEERLRLRGLSTQAYVSGGNTSLDRLGDLLRGDTTDPKGGVAIMFDEMLKNQVARLRSARAARGGAQGRLEAANLRLTQAQQAADDAAAAAADRQRIKAEAEARRFQALVDQQAARNRLRSAAGAGVQTVPLGVPIVGDPVLTPEDLAGWFLGSTYHSALPTPITEFAKWFIDEGRQEGIRGDIAFAQAVLETGGFTNHDSVAYNNYSGIGHCDTCAGGFAFPSPMLGVRAQIQLLKSYAIASPVYVNPLVDSRLHGPRGCCPTWGDLTKKWATAPNYGPIVMGIYSQIVAYALPRHALLLPR
ncbi:MAG: Mannosyl-glycoprotein endo-beta-N-acetylglucosaminidase [Acidimicrobiales bacterium]|nr:Mannosyl-glycoprotein endo-beta-N-acetylglucosaminidase [Acidimicrobiales bacterium]